MAQEYGSLKRLFRCQWEASHDVVVVGKRLQVNLQRSPIYTDENEMKVRKKILYVDMDNVLVDFPSAFKNYDDAFLEQHPNNRDDIPGIFSLMEPLDGAIDAFQRLSVSYDTYILSTAPWNNPSAWSDKIIWVKKYLGDHAKKRLILSHNKNLNRGDFLIDDRKANGAEEFEGEHILFGKEPFPDWPAVLNYLL